MKADPKSKRMPKIGVPIGPARDGIAGVRWTKAKFQNGDVVDFQDKYFSPMSHKSSVSGDLVMKSGLVSLYTLNVGELFRKMLRVPLHTLSPVRLVGRETGRESR